MHQIKNFENVHRNDLNFGVSSGYNYSKKTLQSTRESESKIQFNFSQSKPGRHLVSARTNRNGVSATGDKSILSPRIKTHRIFSARETLKCPFMVPSRSRI